MTNRRSATAVGRILVVGDIHGMYDELQRSLANAGYRPGDRLVFLGDYVNRGSRSREVLDYLVELSRNSKNVFLQGNHEAMILKLFAGRTEYWYMWLEYGGGRPCLASYGIDPDLVCAEGMDYVYHKNGRTISLAGRQETTQFMADVIPPDHLRFLLATSATFETKTFFCCHAGIEPGTRLMAQKVYADCFLKWGDETFLTDETRYEKIIVFGHYHMRRPLLLPNKACIALESSVGILDLTNRIVFDSDGNEIPVEPNLWP